MNKPLPRPGKAIKRSPTGVQEAARPIPAMSDKAKLADGAEEIRKLLKVATATAMSTRLDGTLGAVTKEISRLHGEILTAARTSLSKAIRIGELLSRVRVSRKGRWLAWLKDNAPFSQKTAWNYMACYQRRAELKLVNVTNLSDAYALLLPAKTTGNTQRESVPPEEQSTGIIGDSAKVEERLGAHTSTAEAVAPAPVEQSQPRRRHKSKQSIMDQISTENLERELKESQVEIDKQLGLTLAQISRQSNAAWPDFPARLIEHGKALISEGERLKQGK